MMLSFYSTSIYPVAVVGWKFRRHWSVILWTLQLLEWDKWKAWRGHYEHLGPLDVFEFGPIRIMRRGGQIMPRWTPPKPPDPPNVGALVKAMVDLGIIPPSPAASAPEPLNPPKRKPKAA